MDLAINTSRVFIAVLWVLATLLLSACLEPATETPPTTSLPQDLPADKDWLKIYFTEPSDPNAYNYRGGPDAELAEAIDQARVSVDAALYDLNLWSLRDALLRAHRRGLTVRVVIESDNLDEPEIQALKDEGIPLLGDRREGLMHNKFIVLDRQEVWTGSMNFTTSDAYLNDNHLVRLLSSRLAENFTMEFEEMFEDDLFGPNTRSATPYPIVQLGNSQVETYFSPDDGVAQKLIEQIANAEKSIYFLAFSFTSDEIAKALLQRAAAGVVVVGVFDADQVTSNIGSEYERLLIKGIDVRLDSNPRNMHHKVFVFDEQIVTIGSYNFSSNAEMRNDENILILHHSQAAALFMQEFERIFMQAHR
jgi:phosphatidylserine/phosphatidylglycerophosphate/cardiolipin synthase-like enzyme